MTAFSVRRIGAMVLRHLYIMRRSWPRVLEMAYWPVVNMVVWGFTSQFFTSHSSWVAQAGGVLIGAVLLWDVMFRGNLGVSLSFMEEMWSRNLGHLSVSPLRPYELVVSLLIMSLIRTMVGVVPAVLLAWPLYHFNLFQLGLPVVAFWGCLMMSGWALGLGVSALVLRYGLGAESLAWVLLFAIAPLAGIYYPIAVLPDWLQPLAWALPPAHVFEGLRGVLFGLGFSVEHFLAAAGLSLLYLVLAAMVFLYAHHVARCRGLLLNVGE